MDHPENSVGDDRLLPAITLFLLPLREKVPEGRVRGISPVALNFGLVH
jgi:hypothetical protein